MISAAMLGATNNGEVINPPVAPVITVQPSNALGFQGETVYFNISATSDESLAYQWYREGVAIAGQTTSVCSVDVLNADDNAEYHCVVTGNPSGLFTVSDTATLFVRSNDVTIDSQPVNASVAEGDNAVFTCEASCAYGALTYLWERNVGFEWSDITGGSGGTTDTLTIVGTEFEEDGYQFRCTCTAVESGETETTNEVTLSVSGAIPVINTQPTNQSGWVGQTVWFTVAATGENALEYQWYRTGVAISGQTTDTCNVVTAAVDNYVYTCIVTDSVTGAYVESNGATNTPKANNIVISSQPSNRSVTVGDTAVFQCLATISFGNISYQWQRKVSSSWSTITGGSGSTTRTLTIVNTEISEDGYQFRCLATSDASGDSEYTNTVTLSVSGGPPIITSQPQSVNVPQGTSISFTVGVDDNDGGAVTYRWDYRDSSSDSWATSGLVGSTISTTASVDGRQYRAKPYNDYGTTYSNVVTVTFT